MTKWKIRLYYEFMNESRPKKEPLYKKIYNEIISRIQSGEFKPGDRIPTEAEWAAITK